MIGTIKISQLPPAEPINGSENLIVNQDFDTRLTTVNDVVGILTYISSSGISTLSQGLTGTPDVIVGVITATEYYGDGSTLDNIISEVGIQSTGTLVGSGITTLNFIGAGNTFSVDGSTVNISIAGIQTYVSSSGISTLSQGLTGTPDVIVGVITANEYYGDGSNLDNIISGVGIQSTGTLVGSGITTLNFIGAGNTFSVDGSTVNISIQGGGGETYWASNAAGIHTTSSVGIGTTTPTSELHVVGDINLDDGGTYTTTLQMVTATADRTISFPDATGTVGLVAGSNGQVIYNNAGANAGLAAVTTDGTNVTLTGRFISSLNGAASDPPGTFTGTWFTGGTSTTTKPHVLIEPAGTTSTAWSTSGTGLGVNAASGFTGNLLDLQVNGTSKLNVTTAGQLKTTSGQGDIETGLSPAASDFRVNVNGLFVVRYGANYLSNNLSNGYRQWLFQPGTGFALNSSAFFGWSDQNFNLSGSNYDVKLYRDAAGTLAQRNSTNAQTFRLYNTYDNNGVDFERTSITRDATGLVIDAQKGGTGADPTNLLDLQVGGTSQFRITSGGNIITGGYTLTANDSGATTWNVLNNGLKFLNTAGTSVLFNLHNNAFGFYPPGTVKSTSISGAGVNFYCEINDVFAQRRGTNAQTFRLYNTYTDANNYERFSLSWNSNVLNIANEANGTGTLRGIAFNANGADSTPPVAFTGTWFTGGTTTTTKPQLLIEPTGTTSTAWSTSGTGLGVNAPSGFTGNLLDLQVGGTSQFKITSTGLLKAEGQGVLPGGTESGLHLGIASYFALRSASTNLTSVYIQNSSASNAVASLSVIGSGDAARSGSGQILTSGRCIFKSLQNTTEQENGTNAQTFRLYNTWANNGVDFERTSITRNSSGLVIDAQKGGTGVDPTNLLDLKLGGVSTLRVGADGSIAGSTSPTKLIFDATGPRFTDWVRLGNTFRAGGSTLTVVLNNGGYGFSSTGSVLSVPDTALVRDSAGVVKVTDGSTGIGYIRHIPVAVSALPSAATVGAGTRGFVNDASATTFASVVAGGGANVVPVYSDGTDWRIG